MAPIGIRLRCSRWFPCKEASVHVGNNIADYPRLILTQLTASVILICEKRSRNELSFRRLRRSQPVTSSLHLLVLQEPHAGTMFSRV